MRTNFTKILTLLMVFISAIIIAQIQVSGVVKDSEGEPLPGTYVETENGESVETDIDGRYTITANQGEELTFSFIGMDDKVQTVSGNTMDIVMGDEEGNNTIDEVVVSTVLGTKKKKENDLSSSTLINTETLEKAGETGIVQAMSGKTSGLKITRNNGDPGAGAFIQIRGQNTILGDGSPLIIIDGVPYSNSSVGGDVDGVAQQSRLNDLNPDDVKNVTVIKGAQAAAIYGTGAANGVIIIETKKGSKGKVKVDISSSIAVSEINVEHDKQSTFGQGLPSHYVGLSESQFGSWIANSSTSWGDYIPDRSGDADVLSIGNERFVAESGNVYYPILQKNSRNTYNGVNRDQIFRKGIAYNNNIGVSFGSDRSTTYLSYSNTDEEGIIKNSDYNRQTFRINQGVSLTDKISAKVNAAYSYITSNRIQQGSNLNGLYLGYLRTSPDFDNTDYKGTYYDSNNIPFPNSHRGYRNYLGDQANSSVPNYNAPAYNNPGWTIYEQKNDSKVNRFNITPSLKWDLRDNLSINVIYGLDYYEDKRNTFFPVNSGSSQAVGQYDYMELSEKNQFFNIFTTWNQDFSENFKLSTVVGLNFKDDEYTSSGSRVTNLINPTSDFIIPNGSSSNTNPIAINPNVGIVNGKYTQRKRKGGLYGTISADIANQLLIEVAGRIERPSTVDNNIFYPSIAAGWKFTEALGSGDFLTFGKIRASYAEIGIEPLPYLNKTSYYIGGYGSSYGDVLDSSQYGSIQRSSVQGNPDLKEERIKEFEIGTDLKFLKNRVTFQATYYNRVTEDAILPLDVPASTGYTSQYQNGAKITNKGFELDLGGTIVKTSKLKWKADLNFATNDSKVTDLLGVQSYSLNGFTGTSSRVVEGQPFGVIWGGQWARNDDGSLALDANGFAQYGQNGVIGDPNPDWTGGVSSSLEWKGFTLSALVETSQGGEMWAGTEGVLKYFGIDPETANISVAPTDLKTVDGRTISAGTRFRGNVHDFGSGLVALDAEWYLNNGGGFGQVAEDFVKDASWTRLREVSLFYNIPKQVIESTGLSRIEIGLTGRNLFLWTDFEGVDPELNLTGASKGRGLDYFTNPGTKSYLFSLKLSF
ncbi:tonB-dependent receptor SusC [Flavobacteriaceae bacterium UJ101]|nr:tonB-dependent receptor SusC [Flavobacteriaceae bacterium UJ101]